MFSMVSHLSKGPRSAPKLLWGHLRYINDGWISGRNRHRKALDTAISAESCALASRYRPASQRILSVPSIRNPPQHGGIAPGGKCGVGTHAPPSPGASTASKTNLNSPRFKPSGPFNCLKSIQLPCFSPPIEAHALCLGSSSSRRPTSCRGARRPTRCAPHPRCRSAPRPAGRGW